MMEANLISHTRLQTGFIMKRLFLSGSIVTLLAMGTAQAEVNFAKDVLPIIRDNCIECHGAEKQKGKLRLDSEKAAHDYSIIPGDLDESEFYQRIILPADDDDVMPPKGGPLKKEEIAIIKQWIEEGGKYTGTDLIAPAAEEPEVNTPEVADASSGDFDFNSDIRPILDSLSAEQKAKLMAWIGSGAEIPQQKAAEPQLVETESSEAEKAAIAQLQEKGVLAMKVAQNVNWVQANFRLVGSSIKDDSLALLKDIKNLTDLDLSKTGITDAGLAHIKDLTNLTRLNLNNTAVTDAGLAHLSGLKNLTYLNLYGTSVSDKGLDQLNGIPTLQKLYLWQTKVTDAGADNLKSQLPWLYINRGIELAALAPEPKKEEPKKEEPKKQAAAEKKPEPKKPVEKKPAPEAPSGPSIADVVLFLTKAQPETKEPAAKVAVKKVAEVKKPVAVQKAPVVKKPKVKAPEPQQGPSISKVLLFLSQAASPAPEPQKTVEAKSETNPLSIAKVLLEIN